MEEGEHAERVGMKVESRQKTIAADDLVCRKVNEN